MLSLKLNYWALISQLQTRSISVSPFYSPGMELNCTMFNSPGDDFRPPCDEYVNLVTILTKPGLRRLDIPLLIGGQEYRGWSAFRSGYLHRMLSNTTELGHFSLSTTVDGGRYNSSIDSEGEGGSMDHFVPLQYILPITSWHKLRHFHSSTFIVAQYDIMGLVTILFANIQPIS